MDGPEGVSHCRDAPSPPATEIIPNRTATMAMRSGVREMFRAAAAGMINREIISSMPTIFIAIAMTVANKGV